MRQCGSVKAMCLTLLQKRCLAIPRPSVEATRCFYFPTTKVSTKSSHRLSNEVVAVGTKLSTEWWIFVCDDKTDSARPSKPNICHYYPLPHSSAMAQEAERYILAHRNTIISKPEPKNLGVWIQWTFSLSSPLPWLVRKKGRRGRIREGEKGTEGGLRRGFYNFC